MFPTVSRYSTLFLILLTLSGGWYWGRLKEGEAHMMREQLDRHKVTHSTTLLSTTEQKRTGVVKDLWIAEDNGPRLHHRICSASSLLTIVPEGNRVDLIEKLQSLTCWMQDKLYPTSQQARLLVAQEGFYHYSSQEFIAQSVDLSLYNLEGNTLPEKSVSTKPFLKGIAEDVSFSVAGKTAQFRAKQFKAELAGSKEKS